MRLKSLSDERKREMAALVGGPSQPRRGQSEEQDKELEQKLRSEANARALLPALERAEPGS